jgi:hypothetical protein
LAQLTQHRGGRLDGLISPFIEVGNDEMEEGGILLGEVERLCARLPELATKSLLEVLGFQEDVLVYLGFNEY